MKFGRAAAIRWIEIVDMLVRAQAEARRPIKPAF
jgi:hypothetical protein